MAIEMEKIWIDDRGPRPHTTQEGQDMKRLREAGWKMFMSPMDIGDDAFDAVLVRGEERHPVIIGWNDGILPLRWAKIPKGILNPQ